MMKHSMLMLMLVVISQTTAKEQPSSSHFKCYRGVDDKPITPKFGLSDLIFWLKKIKFYLATNDRNELYNFQQLFGPNDKYLNWDKSDNLLEGFAKRTSVKILLERYNTWSMYKGWYPSAQCKESDYLVRQFDGTCNDEKLNAMGSVGTRFGRNAFPVSPKNGRDLLFPNPRTVSRKLLAKKAGEETKVHKHLNLLVTAWVQGAVHDTIKHVTSKKSTDVIKIPLDNDDPLAKNGQRYIYVAETENDNSRLKQEASLPKTFKNYATHWIDAEQIYGNSKAVADSLRTFKNGMMKLEDDGIFPIGHDGLPKTGVNDNWWLGLELVHNLMVKEHNSIASMLSNKYPHWTDQKLYDTTRMITAALTMKIHFTEWFEAIGSHPGTKISSSVLFGQLPKHLKNPAALPFIAPLLPDGVKKVLHGTLGSDKTFSKNPIDGSDVPQFTTEEYTSFYKLHSLLPDSLNLYKLDNSSVTAKQGMANLADTVGAKSHHFFVNNSMGDLLLSFGLNHAPKLTLNNFPAFLQNLETSKGNFIDLGAIDILRDRERELPLYNELREKMKLQRFDTLNDLTDDNSVIQALEEVYGKDKTIDKVDLMIGMLAEKSPNCFGIGEISSNLLFLEGSSFMAKDSFYTNKFTEEVYTKEGIEWIRNNRLKDVLLRHAPELSSTGLKNIDNAFYFWG